MAGLEDFKPLGTAPAYNAADFTDLAQPGLATADRAQPATRYDGLIENESARTGVPAKLIRAVLTQESSFNPRAVNRETGATGLAQLMPATARELGVTDRADPAQSIRGAADYLAQGLRKYNGDVTKALQYYYGGPNESQWGPRTAAYPAQVLRHLNGDPVDLTEDDAASFERASADAVTGPSPTPPATPALPPLKWETVANSPKYQEKPFAERERIRNQYFADFIAPKVPTDQLEAVKASFDRDTKPTLLGKVGDVARGVGGFIAGAAKQTLNDITPDTSVMRDMGGKQVLSDTQASPVAPMNTLAYQQVKALYDKLSPAKRQEMVDNIDPATATPSMRAMLQIHDETIKKDRAALDASNLLPNGDTREARIARYEAAGLDNAEVRVDKDIEAGTDNSYKAGPSKTFSDRIAALQRNGVGLADAQQMALKQIRLERAGVRSAEMTPYTAPANPHEAENYSIYRDIAHMLGQGADIAAQDTRELTRRVLGKTNADMIDSIDKYLNGTTTDELFKANDALYRTALSWGQQQALDKKWYDQKTGKMGPAWSDPLAYLGGVTQSLPEMGITMAPGMVLARGIYTAQLARGVPEVIAAGKAATAAMVAGGISEGALAGAQSSRQVREQIATMPFDELRKYSDAFKELVDQGGMTPEQARDAMANDSATIAFWLAGVSTGAFGGMGDRFMAKAITSGVKGGLLARIGQGMASEGIFEELPQSLTQQLSENIAMRRADRRVSLDQDVLNQGFGGLAVGAAMGGSMGIAAKHEAPPPESVKPSTGAGSAPKSTGEPRQSASFQQSSNEKSAGNEPIDASTVLDTVDAGAHEAAISPQNEKPIPTKEQIQGGNAELGHVNVGPFDISVENPAGSVRKDLHNEPPKWETTMQDHYGYFKGVEARAPDKEHVDTYVKAGTPTDYSGSAFIIDQNKGNGQFDEPKVMLGFETKKAAIDAYLAHYEAGWDSRVRGVTEVSMDELKARLSQPDAFKQPQPDAHPFVVRTDQEKRKKVADMTPEERATALLKDDLTGLPNRRAYEENDRLPVQTRTDLDDFKGINDKYGHQVGDLVLKAAAHALDLHKKAGRVYRIGGDEFPGEFNNVEEARAAMQLVQGELARSKIEYLDKHGKKQYIEGVGFSYGIANDEAGAEAALIADKAKRKAAGLRKGERASPESAAGEQDHGNSDAQRQETGNTETVTPADAGVVHLGTYGVMPSKNNKALTLQKEGDTYTLLQDGKPALDFDSGEPITYKSVDEAVTDLKAELKRESRRFLSNKQGIYFAPEFKGEKSQEKAMESPEGEKSATAETPATPAEQNVRKDEPATTPKDEIAKTKQAAREIEREAFAFVLGLPDTLKASAMPLEQFGHYIRGTLKTWQTEQSQAAATGNDQARATHINAFSVSDAMLNSLYKEAKQRAKEAEREAGRDPAIYQAKLAEVMTNAELAEGEQTEFKRGFDHALAGRTKSTLTGETAINGYTAARDWISTPEGRNFFEGKRGKKLENTGVDLRRWFDKAKADAAAAGEEWQKVMRVLDKLTARSEVLRPDLPNATPGTKRMVDWLRANLRTYKEFIGYRNGNRRTFDEWLERQFNGRYLTEEQQTERLASFRKKADEYLDRMRELSEALSGVNSVAAMAPKMRETLFSDDNEYSPGVHPQFENILPWGDDRRRVSNGLKRIVASPAVNDITGKEDEADSVGDRSKPLIRPRLDNISREGRTDFRKGKDVTPQEFKAKFGFADVGFGKWVGAKQDQDHLNYAYDAFMDLADLLGIQPKDIGLGGKLHFTIGALGHGKHAAHYQDKQPSEGGAVRVINVTNTRGDGTVAHEWFHALDFALRHAKKPDLIAEMVRRLKKQKDISTIDDAVEKFLRGGWYYKRSGLRNGDKVAQARYALEYGDYGQAKTTQYKINADALGEEYWGNDEELLARAGEAYVYDLLAGTRSDYLVTDWVGDGKTTKEQGYRGVPYPQGVERERFNRLLGKVVKAIEFNEEGPTVSPENLADIRQQFESEDKAFDDHKKDTLDQLAAIYAAHRAKQKEKFANDRPQDTSDADKLIEDQKRREAERLALENATPETYTSDKALSEDELSSLFDEAAAELREGNQEKPDAPSPGAPTVSAGVANPSGNATKAEIERAQNYANMKDQIARDDRTAAKLAAEAAKLGVKGIDEALKGLVQLFGGNSLKSFPAGLDEESYKKAKPHFEAALQAFIDAGKTLKDLFKFLIQNFGEGVKPYAIHFAQEKGLISSLAGTQKQAQDNQQEPSNVPDQSESPRVDQPGDAGQSTADVPSPEGERGSGEGSQRPGATGDGIVSDGHGGTAEGASAGTAESSTPAAAGSENNGSKGGKRGGDRTGDRVPERKTDRGADFLAPVGSLAREGSWKLTAARNLDVIELIKQLDAEKRQATPEEQAKLVKFTGWGSSELAQGLFPQHDTWAKPEWKELVERRAKLMDETERAAAARSTRNAHYTSEDVIRGMWTAMQAMGFEGGNILEPGMGIGLFAVAAPPEVMAHSRYTGIEYDRFTAKIAAQLLPQENVIQGDYAKTKLPKDFFDIAIGNPPFAADVIKSDPEYARLGLMLHDYFFAKTIDRVRPGGLLAFVTSKGTMDKGSDKGRRYLADRADLLGAVRLPQTAFLKNAGTEVVTDILFLRKRMPGEVPAGEAWQQLATVKTDQGNDTLVNEYYANHPEMVLGNHSLTGTMYRKDSYTVVPFEDRKIEDVLKEALDKLPKGIYTPKTDAQSQTTAAVERDFNPKSKKEGTLYLSDKGELMRVDSGSGVPLHTQLEKPLGAKELTWLADYVGLRDAVKQAQYDQLTDGEWEKSLKALNKVYDAFVKKHGNIRDFTKIEKEDIDEDTGEKKVTTYYRWKNAKLLFQDVESPMVEMLEAITEDDKIVKAAFLKDRSVKKPSRPQINTTKDALLVTLDERGKLDLDYIANLRNISRDQVITELGDSVYEAPNGEWQMGDEYLSGDVITKLEEAEAAAAIDAKYRRNVEALLKVQPRPLAPKDITVGMGAIWVPMETYEAFAAEVLGNEVTIEHVPASNSWKIEQAGRRGGSLRAGRYETNDWGTPQRSALEIFQAALSGQDIKITFKDEAGRTHTDAESTAAANEKLKLMKAEFNRWIWQDAKRGERTAAIYNRQFNNIAPRKFDGSHLTLPGLSLKYTLFDHQKRAIWRVIQTGNTYLAHAVGAGKTLEMIVAGMEQKRLGLISKPMYAVPKHMLKQFASEFLDAYPAANILVADDKHFDPLHRGRFVAQAALNNPDAIIITHPAFTKLSVKEESRQRVADRFIADLKAAIEEEDNKFRRKEMEAQLERLERRFFAKTSGKKDAVVDFEDLGVDFIFIDEAHEFRKLDFVSRRGNIKGIDPNGSARALDLFVKIQHLENQRPGRTTVLASGTPVVNTIAELYTIQRFMDMTQLEKDSIDHFDVWANQFGDIRRELEQNAAGSYEFVERFAQFVNVPELMKRVRSKMDVLTNSQLGHLVKRPDIEGGQPNLIINPASSRLTRYLKEELARRIETSRKWKPSPQEPGNPDPLINIITDGRLAAIDMRFVDRNLKDDPESKLSRMLEEIIKRHKANAELTYTDKETGATDHIKGGTQIVFSAVGFGEQVAKSRGFDIKEEIINKLKEGGIPRSEIAFMDEYQTDAKKAQLFKDMRAGKIKVLFGSPKNMGTGVNVQKRLKNLHFLSPPWYPADEEQPRGRIVRQGNQNSMVGIDWYATKGTYDSTMWQMLARKSAFIEQAFTGDDSVRKLDDVSESSQYEMASALSSGDQRAIQLAGLNADVERLTRLQAAHANEQATFRGRKSSLEFQIKQSQKRIDRYTKAADEIGDHITNMTLSAGGKNLTERLDIGEFVRSKMQDFLATKHDDKTEPVEIGKVQGKYPLITAPAVYQDSAGNKLGVAGNAVSLKLILPQQIEYEIEAYQRDPMALDPSGLYTRIRNKLNAVSGDLYAEESSLAGYKHELEKTEARLGVPFQFESDLFDKVAEANRIKSELANEGKEKAIESAATGENENPDAEGDDEAKFSSNIDAAKPFVQNAQREYLPDTQGDAERLRAEASRAFGVNIPAGAIRIVRLPDHSYLQRIASAFGKRVVGFESTSPLLNVNGSTFPGGDVIYINIDATRPHLAVLGHELGHQFKKESPALYTKLVDFMRTQIDQSKYGQFGKNYKGYDEEAIREEFVGEVFSDGFMDRGFWYSLASHNQSLFDHVVASLQKLWAKVKEALKPYTPKTDKYFKDHAAIMRAAGEAMAKYQASKGVKAGPMKFNSNADTAFAANFMAELADQDSLYKLPKSDAQSLEGVLADTNPTLHVIGDATREDERAESGADKRMLIRSNNGRDVFVYQRGKDIWLDVSRLDEGEGGDALYQGVANYANNAGLRFIGDPAGLSNAATIRRTYHMLASALRFGTTEHFQPAPEQLKGDPEKGIVPLKWEGSDFDKVQSLIKTFVDTQRNLFPELRNVRYDFARREFVDTANGDARVDVADLASGKGREAKAGGRAARAGVLLASLIRSESSARPGLLAQVLRQPTQLVEAVRPVFNQADTTNQPIDSRRGFLDEALRRAGGQVLANYGTKPAYNWLIETGSKLIPETVKAGLVDKYGLTPAYIDQRNAMYTGQAKGAIEARSVVDQLTLLDRQQSRIAYLWMTQKDEETGNKLLEQLPAESQALLKALKQQIHEMGEEAVLLHQLTAEAFQRHDMAYLHRTYQKYEAETPGDKAKRQRAIRILGDQYKGRGMTDYVADGSLQGRMVDGKPVDIKGQMYRRLELRRGKTQRLFGMVYWPESMPVPEMYKDWKQEGTWEARYFNKKGKVGLWRDFTAEERQKMGEIDEIKYALAKTLSLMTYDIEVGRFFKWIAGEYAATGPEGLNVVDASENLGRAYKKDEWVHVPTSNVKGTSVPVYGALAGLYVPGPIWNDIRQIANIRFQPFGKMYDDLLKAWKISKTALSPATHFNNVMGNFLMADMNDVGFRDLARAVKIMLADTPDAKAMLERFELSGAQLGSFVSKEIKRETLQNLLKQLQAEMDNSGVTAQVKMADIVARVFAKDFGGAFAGIADTKLGRLTTASVNKAMDVYQMEDTIFRFAAFLKAIDDGHLDIEAGRMAREDFLDYNITAPWINAMRGSFFPFIAFPYRAVPMLVRTFAEKPWKIYKYMAIAGGLNALAYALMGLGGGDEDRERALLPDEKSGKLWGMIPKLIRMPWNDSHASPVFLDVRRWIPVGDIVDFGQNHGAVPIPPMLMPGGPLWMLAEIVANRSTFTGKAITLETDTATEQIVKSLDYLYKGAMPNLVGVPGAYATTSVYNAAKGRTDVFGRDQSVPMALASSVGLKLGAYPRDQLLRNEKMDFDIKDRELKAQQQQVAREAVRGGISKEEMAKEIEVIKNKRLKEAEKLRAKVNAGR